VICLGANQFDQFASIHLARPALKGAKSNASENQFREPIQADPGCPVLRSKNLFPKIRSCGSLSPSRPHQGALRNVINAGRDAMDAGGAKDEGAILATR
jgi:hypothetical protein